MIRNISIDAGKFDCKAIMLKTDGTEKKLSFRTKMSGTIDRNVTHPDKSFIVKYEGHTYMVGDDASDTSVSYTTSKMDLLHKVVTYTAIGNLIDNGDQINLVIGCPLSIYANVQKKNEYRDYIAPRQTQIKVSINGIDKTFVINRVYVCPESSGVIYGDSMKYSDTSVGVIDIGGLNVNACIFEEDTPKIEYSFTEELGSNKMMVEVQTALETEFATNINSVAMNDLKRDGYLHGKYKERSTEIFEKMKKDHLTKILESCVRHGWTLDMMSLVFIGGSSVLLKNEITDLVKTKGYDIDLDVIDPNCNFLNAQGFMEYLKAMTSFR